MPGVGLRPLGDWEVEREDPLEPLGPKTCICYDIIYYNMMHHVILCYSIVYVNTVLLLLLLALLLVIMLRAQSAKHGSLFAPRSCVTYRESQTCHPPPPLQSPLCMKHFEGPVRPTNMYCPRKYVIPGRDSVRGCGNSGS